MNGRDVTEEKSLLAVSGRLQALAEEIRWGSTPTMRKIGRGRSRTAIEKEMKNLDDIISNILSSVSEVDRIATIMAKRGSKCCTPSHKFGGLLIKRLKDRTSEIRVQLNGDESTC